MSWHRLAFIAALVLGCTAASAQNSAVTFYGGARSGGTFYDEHNGSASVKFANGAAFAMSYDWLMTDGRQGQVFYSFQHTSLPGSVLDRPEKLVVDVHYLHVGGRVFFDGGATTHGGYVVGGLGLTLFSPKGAGLTSELRPSANLGIGYQWMLSKELALRTELRGYLTLVNSSGDFFCSGGCVVAIRGDGVSQGEGLLGLSFNF